LEYALIAAGIAVAIIVAVFALGDEVKSLFGDVQTQLEGAGN
jgi:Flp pilus assembly pilin Flp